MKIGENVTNPGELRVRITLENRVMTQDTGGFWHEEVTVSLPVWAKWRNAYGSESWVAATNGATEPATVRIRYQVVDPTWKVVKGTKVYEIISMDDIQEKHEYLELKVKRVAEG
ncbi:MAG: phage head closure protein [Anaerolineaceae bacterium]